MTDERLYPTGVAPRVPGEGCSTRSTGAPQREAEADGVTVVESAFGPVVQDLAYWKRNYRAAESDYTEARAALDEARAEVERLRAQKDGAYAERNQCVALIARMALALGWPVYVAQHPTEDTNWEDDWRTILFVGLPSGQVTWHFHDSERHLLADLPSGKNNWDGHDTPEKYRRVNLALTGERRKA